jgi:predicted acylesterase/phospholipase RssA
MNILYLHGLKSKLSTGKRRVLELYGNVYAPDIDCDYGHIQPIEILKQYANIEFNVVIGSSMGALNAYIISDNTGRPALLFNPPVSKYKNVTFEAKFLKGISSKQLLLGGNDDVVNPSETLNFLGQHLSKAELNIKTDTYLGHRIPVSIFEEQVKLFFSTICY